MESKNGYEGNAALIERFTIKLRRKLADALLHTRQSLQGGAPYMLHSSA